MIDKYIKFVDSFYSLASEKDAKELMKINLSQIPKNIPQDQNPQEYYQLLNEQAKDGPIFNRQTIEYVHNLSEAILPNNRKQFVKWLANQRQSGVNISNNDIITIKDYLNNVDVNLDKISFPELLELSNNWHTEEFEIQENTGPYKTKDVVYSFDNGYTIVKVPSEDLGTEGSKMGHCVGSYCDAVYSGKKEIYSLRDSKNEPHVTIELSGNKIEQIKGKENKPPIEAYAQMVKEWLFDTFKPEQFVDNEDYIISLPFEDILEMVRTTPDDQIDWYSISINRNLTEDFIREHKDKLDWHAISIHLKLSEDFIREFKYYVDWHYISKHQKLSEKFIKEFQNKIDFRFLSINKNLTEDFIREFQDKINWNYISKYQKLSEELIKEFQDKVDWYLISVYQNLSEDFIREFQDKLGWINISVYQNLSEDFIREFQDKVYWNSISAFQKLSEEFIIEFWPKLNKSKLLENENIPDDVKNNIREKIQKAALFNIVDRFYKISQMIF